MRKRLIDIIYENEEVKNYGKGTIVCNSWEEFDDAIKDIKCVLSLQVALVCLVLSPAA